jgi:hypothetical protein
MTIAFAERAQLVILDEAIDPLLMVATSLLCPKRRVVLKRVMSGGEETGRVNTSTIKRGLSEISRDVLTFNKPRIWEAIIDDCCSR